ncbi:hypothetical protein PSCLAVI8L_130395 [Pseudoclavibacter sp. 8L]|nr:hypothetical protein PSCLAVI8L_130395 [Pseudoclavibacter sp. 8L]
MDWTFELSPGVAGVAVFSVMVGLS